jgi:hypothetical protein
MNEPKQQHYVPRMLLKNFVDDNTGKLHFFSKKCPEKGVLQALPEKLFREQHLYTRWGNNGTRDFSIENGLAVLSWFIASQQARVPDFQDSVASDTEFEEIAHRTAGTIEAVGVLPTPAEREKLLSSGGLIVRITKHNKSFVIGSRPVVRPGRMHIEDATGQAWLPIAHDVAVLLFAGNGGPASIEIIRWLNEALFKQSTFVAGRSNKLLASLSGCRCRSVG